MSNVTIGSDFEYFVKQGSELSHAIGMIGGSKDEPRLVRGGNVQEDNVLAEGATDVANSKLEFVAMMQSVQEELRSIVGTRGHQLLRIPAAHYKMEELKAWGEQALTLGCSPDTNAYTLTDNPRPDGEFNTLRTAAGHVHFGYEGAFPDLTADIVVGLDYILGLWSVCNDPDTTRRALYGKAGSCRIKAYGGEYRVLSNFWIEDTDMIEFVYDVTTKMVDVIDDFLMRAEPILSRENVQNIINNSLRDQAEVYLPLMQEILNELS